MSIIILEVIIAKHYVDNNTVATKDPSIADAWINK